MELWVVIELWLIIEPLCIGDGFGEGVAAISAMASAAI